MDGIVLHIVRSVMKSFFQQVLPAIDTGDMNSQKRRHNQVWYNCACDVRCGNYGCIYVMLGMVVMAMNVMLGVVTVNAYDVMCSCFDIILDVRRRYFKSAHDLKCGYCD